MTSREGAPLAVAAVLLAAGESTRMGEMKALLPWVDGEPLAAYQVRSLHAAGYAPIVVVLGHDADSVRSALPQDVAVTTVVNERYREGRSTSIATGARALDAHSMGAFVVLSVDQPRSVALLRVLREVWERERSAIVVPSYQGRGGHPPLFDARLMANVAQVREETEGLRQVMRDFAAYRRFADVDDPLALTNLNTHEDYEAALSVAKVSHR